MSNEEFNQRYMSMAHAIQSGIAQELALDPTSGTPKHLRVGNDLRAADAGALVALLIRKGIFTDEEYKEAILLGYEKEVDRLEKSLSEKMRVSVSLL